MADRIVAKNEVKIRISDSLNNAARKLAAKTNVAIAEVLAQAVERGMPILIEEDNKINWWDESIARSEIKSLLDSLPSDKQNEAIAYLKSLKSNN
ncbi:MAG: hypothetical protein KME42_13855 [Tildeniella nuda ZEHNDER 1965/U140]|jgi:hypothetical protein|nr:hypothetical protein [Tildeniella nuda ZEHNDER 1965/U140]